MNRWLWTCLLCFFLNPFSVNAINALVSYDVFYLRNKDTLSPYIELYWQIDAQTLSFSENEKGHWMGGVATQLMVKTDTGILANKQFVLNTYPAASKAAALGQNILDLHRLSLPAGQKIWIELQFTDIADLSNTFSYRDSIVASTARAKAFFSDIQLLDTAFYSSDSKNMFYKGGRLQIPLSTNFLDDRRDLLHYYAELYKTNELTDSLLVRSIFVSREEGGAPILGLLQTDTIRRRDPILGVNGSFNTELLASGNYYINMLLSDEHGMQIARSSAFFQRMNTVPVQPKDTAAAADTGIQHITIFDLSETFVGKYTIAQLRAILKMLLPVSTPLEAENIKGFLKRPDETYMRYLVYNFWVARDKKEPEKAWKQFTKTVKDVNKLFGSSAKPGYESERGMVYLKYGKPQQRIVVNNETGALPYELWLYNATEKRSSQGVFLFFRPGYMVSDFQLLHSTVPGEMRNMAWREFLYKAGGQARATSNFRAEEYLK